MRRDHPCPDHRPTHLLLGITLLAGTALPASAAPDTPPAVAIVTNGQSVWHMLAPSSQTPGVPWAVEEWRKYIRQMSGCDLPVGNAATSGPAVVIGLRGELSAADQAVLPAPARGYDGYAVLIRAAAGDQSPRIIVAGDNPRGAIYGVYDLLARLGCRWFYPTQNPNDPEVVPHRTTVSLPPGSWSVAAPLKHRICNGSSWFFDMNMAAAGQQLDWAMKNRYNGMGWQCADKIPPAEQFEALRKAGLIAELSRRGMFLHGPAHSFQLFLRAEDHMDHHPEWFGLRDGKRVPQSFLGAQFCWSNAHARHEFVDNVEKFVRACPELNVLCIVPFDGGQACACPECRKIGASNALMVLMGDVADRLEKSAPNVSVQTVGGYGPMTDPPIAELHPRLGIVWAHWGRHYGSGYDDPKYPLRANLEAWRKAAKGGLTVCQYYTDNFAEPWVIPPFALAIQGDRRYFLDQGIDAVYMLMWSPGFWWNHGLNGYLAGRCFYDAALDPFPLIEDYALHYYGPAAGPLLGRYYEQWARDVDLAYCLRGDSLPKHWQMLSDQRKNLIAPAMAAVQADPLLAARVARVEKLHELAERLCENHRRRYQIQWLRERGDFAQAQRNVDEARIYAESVLYWFYALADLDQGLIERKDIGWFPKIVIRDWVDAEAKAIAAQQTEVEGARVWKSMTEADLFPSAATIPK